MDEPLEQQCARLSAENARLREENRKIEALVNHVAHELRTPLTSISGFSEFLLKHGERQSPEKLRYYCEILFLESSRLSRMVDNLLDLSRMRAGKLGLTLAPISLGAIAERSVKNLQLQAAEKEISLSCAAAPDLPLLQADPDKLQQVLTNLVANAIHYSPKGASVQVGVRRDGDHLLAWVKDNGIGIAPQDQERIFEEFYRVEGKGSAGTKGTGLGLPISRTIVELHGGRLWVESHQGQGSTFFFAVPLHRPAEGG
jgi:two-component system, OmpR family, phosphate regulon sensor histidine kinase PhoR